MILFCITTYNQLEYTKLFYDSLQKTSDIEYDLIVVDDFSNDGTIQWCKEKNITIIEKKKPHGLTHSWNLIYDHFKNNKQYEYLVIANNDILVPHGALSEMVNVFERYPASVVVPLSTKKGVGHNPIQAIGDHFQGTKEESENPNNYQAIQDMLIQYKDVLRSKKDLFLLDPFRMKHFNGFFFMLNRNVIQYENPEGWLFDPVNLMYKNEDTFNWKVLLPKDDNPWLCKTAFIYHWKGVSTGKAFKNLTHEKANNIEWINNRK